MMAAKNPESTEVLLKEFEKWQEETSSEAIFLLEVLLNNSVWFLAHFSDMFMEETFDLCVGKCCASLQWSGL